jgi:hypothetical protein
MQYHDYCLVEIITEYRCLSVKSGNSLSAPELVINQSKIERGPLLPVATYVSETSQAGASGGRQELAGLLVREGLEYLPRQVFIAPFSITSTVIYTSNKPCHQSTKSQHIHK